MKRLAAAALGAAVFAGVAVPSLGGHAGLGRPLVLRRASPSPLLGLHYGLRQQWLVRLDPKTLKARPGRRLGLAEFSGGWSYSPNRRLLAFGNYYSPSAPVDIPARLRLVDAQRLRTVHYVPLGVSGAVLYVYWAAPHRLLALVRSGEDAGREGEPPVLTDRVVVVDPLTGSISASTTLDGSVAALATAEDALALVLEEPRAYGPVRLAVANVDGKVGSVILERVQAGLRTVDPVPREDGAAVAVDRQDGRAYVVAAGYPVAEVDLATLAIGYHTPSQPVSLLTRLHDWLEPTAQAKGPLEGSTRYATWLGDGRLAIYGRDMSTYQAADGLAVRQRPSGLVVIDTLDWTAHMVDPRSSSLVVANGALLSWGLAWDGGTHHESGTGLDVYDKEAGRRFHLFGAQVVYDAQAVGSRAFVRTKRLYGRYAVISLRTGHQLRTIRGEELPLVLTTAGPIFYG